MQERFERLLVWSERYTKTDMRYLARGGFWLGVGQVVSVLISMGLAIAFANLISREEYGTYKYVLSLAGTLGAFSLAGLGTFVTQSVSRGFEGAMRYSFRLNLLWNIPILICALGAALYYGLHGNMLLSGALIIIGVTTPLLTSAQLYPAYLTAKGNFRLASAYGVGITLFQAAAVFLGLFFHVSVLWLVGIYFAANMLATLACYVLVVRAYKPNGEVDHSMAQFSARLSLANTALAFAGQFDKILLFHFLGAAPVAVWSLAQAPVTQLRAALKITTPLALPKLAGSDRTLIARTLEGKLWRLTLAIFVAVIGYIIVVPYFFRIFFPFYMDAVPYSQAYVLVLLLFPKKITSLALYAQEERRGQYLFAVAGPAAQLVLLLALIPFFGIWGAVGASLGSNLVSNFLVSYYFRKFKKENA